MKNAADRQIPGYLDQVGPGFREWIRTLCPDHAPPR